MAKQKLTDAMVEAINMGNLRKAVKSFNSILDKAKKLKVGGLTKKDLAMAFTKAVEKAAGGKDAESIPADAVTFYNAIWETPEPGPDDKKPPAKKKEPKEKSRYGHQMGTQSAQLDDLFFKGTTMEAAAEAIGSKVGRVKGHLQHLRNDKGLTVNENEKTKKFKVAA